MDEPIIEDIVVENTTIVEPVSVEEEKADIPNPVVVEVSIELANIKEPEPEKPEEPTKEVPKNGEKQEEIKKEEEEEEDEKYIATIPDKITKNNITSVIFKNIFSVDPSSSTILSDIEKAIKDITKDGKIDTKDIPNFIIIVQKVYQFIYDTKGLKLDAKKRYEITAESLKCVIYIMVREGKIEFENDDKRTEFLIQTDALIDSCIGLLSFSKKIKPKSCLGKLFG